MNRKSTYWIVGILAAVLVLLLIWAVSAGMGRKDSGTGQGSAADHSQMSHGQSSMDSSWSGGSSQDTPVATYLAEEDKIMADMMRDMAAVQKSGSASIDFLAGMIPHHESAVAMAQSYLKYGGESQALRELAENVIDTQTQEIAQMKTMIEDREAGGETDKEKEAAYWKEYEALFSGHHTDHSAADRVDEAFADGMILHHQMAVDMSNAILNHTDDEEVRALAHGIIDAQTEEISRMQDILNELPDA